MHYSFTILYSLEMRFEGSLRATHIPGTATEAQRAGAASLYICLCNPLGQALVCCQTILLMSL